MYETIRRFAQATYNMQRTNFLNVWDNPAVCRATYNMHRTNLHKLPQCLRQSSGLHEPPTICIAQTVWDNRAVCMHGPPTSIRMRAKYARVRLQWHVCSCMKRHLSLFTLNPLPSPSFPSPPLPSLPSPPLPIHPQLWCIKTHILQLIGSEEDKKVKSLTKDLHHADSPSWTIIILLCFHWLLTITITTYNWARCQWFSAQNWEIYGIWRTWSAQVRLLGGHT